MFLPLCLRNKMSINFPHYSRFNTAHFGNIFNLNIYYFGEIMGRVYQKIFFSNILFLLPSIQQLSICTYTCNKTLFLIILLQFQVSNYSKHRRSMQEFTSEFLNIFLGMICHRKPPGIYFCLNSKYHTLFFLSG